MPAAAKALLAKLLNNESVNIRDPEFAPVIAYITANNLACHRINHTEPRFEELNALFAGFFEGGFHPGIILVPPVHIFFPCHMRFGERLFINHGLTAMASGGISLGDDCFIGPNVSLLTDNHVFGELNLLHPKRIIIGSRVWIGAGALVLPGVTVGDEACVGAGAVVTHDVEPRTVVAGNPARVIRRL